MSENLLREHGIRNEHIGILKEILRKKELILNPMQVDFIEKGFLEKNRVIVQAPTASGKTLLVYLKYMKNLENGKGRMIYLVPYVRIRRELLKKLAIWEKLGIVATDGYDAYDKGKAQIFVATYASIDSLLLRGKKPTSDFFVFDEIDMVTDDLQGVRVESSIARILRESEISTLFALSATIGSPELTASWLDCATFTSDYRPGDFTKTVEQYSHDKKKFEIIDEIFHSPNNNEEPMMVFYYNRKKCRQNAVKLAQYRADRVARTTNPSIALAKKEIFGKCDVTSEVNEQIKCLNYKVAFYHARLQPQCREIIERLLATSIVDIVFTTPALARGTNMPTRTVVIPHPFKFSPSYGNVVISRTEIEQIFGRACRPPFQDKGFGVAISTTDALTERLKERVYGDLQKMNSKFLQSTRTKGRILNQYRLAIEVIKEAKMQKRSEEQLSKLFESYLFMQEIKDKEGFYKFLQSITSQLMKVGLLSKNIDEEIITPEVVDVVIDHGVDDLNRMLRLINLSKDVIDNRFGLFSGHIISDVLSVLCKNYTSFGIGTIKDTYDSEKIQKYVTEKTMTEPPKIGNEHRLFTALDLYFSGASLKRIEEEFGLEPDSLPYIATNVVYRDLILLTALIEHQCMGDRDKMNFCRFLEMCANITKRGIPYQVLPFAELISRFRRDAAANILRKYGSAVEILRVLKDEQRTKREFITIDGIGSILSQRILKKRKELIENLQRKITLWGTFSS